MAWSSYYDAPTGLTLYAKPKPLVASPWGDDAIAMTESGSTGEYAVTGLSDGIDYTVFIQSGGSPASSDVKDGSIFYRVSQADIATIKSVSEAIKAVTDNLPDNGALTAINTTVAVNKKLLEADRISVFIAGSYYERTLERGTGTQLIPDKKIKQTDGATDLVNPITQRYGGAVEE